MRRITPRRVLVVWLGLLGACGPKPTAPTTPPPVDLEGRDRPLALSAERHLLQIGGFDDSTRPDLPPCVPALVPRAGKVVTTFVWFAWEGTDLVGRSRPPYESTLEIRLRRVSASVTGVVVTGTVSGSAADEYDRFMGKRDTTFGIDAGQVATLSGLLTPQAPLSAFGPTLNGLWHGTMRFSDSTSATAACTTVQYLLQVLPPGGPDDDPTLPPIAPAIGQPARSLSGWSQGPWVMEPWPHGRRAAGGPSCERCPISLTISRSWHLAPRLLLGEP